MLRAFVRSGYMISIAIWPTMSAFVDDNTASRTSLCRARCWPVKPGHTVRHDSEYKRYGTANTFASRRQAALDACYSGPLSIPTSPM